MKSKILYSFHLLTIIFSVLFFGSSCKQKGKTIAEKVVVKQPEELAPTTSEIIRSTLQDAGEDGRLDSFHIRNILLTSEWYKESDYKKEYLNAKKLYRDRINYYKKIANEEYITNSSDRCKAAWRVIKNETGCRVNNREIVINSNNFNKYFIIHKGEFI